LFGFAVLVFAKHRALLDGHDDIVGMGFYFARTLVMTPLCMDCLSSKIRRAARLRWWIRRTLWG